MSAALDRAAERMGAREHGRLNYPGLGLNAGPCTGEMSTGSWSAGKKHVARPHEATSAKRFNVKPNAGNVSELWTGVKVAGADDGSEMMREYREAQRNLPLPVAKTRKQDDLALTIELLRDGINVPQAVRQDARALVAKILETDPEHGRAWLAAGEAVNL